MRSTLVCAALFSFALSPPLARAQDLQKLSQDPKQWVMAQHDYANTRLSALDQINTTNVGKLHGVRKRTWLKPFSLRSTISSRRSIKRCKTTGRRSSRPTARNNGSWRGREGRLDAF